MIRTVGSGLLAALVVFGGCEKRKAATGDDAPWASREADQRYTVRGRVVRAPEEGAALRIHHEAIPGFRNREGAIVGMNAMAMEFPAVAENATPPGLTAGDVVEFDFEVYWTPAAPRWLVTRIERLDPTTALDLGGEAREYTVRGEIVSVPNASNPASELVIRHEAIPDLVDANGTVIGMESMAMPFPSVADGVSLEGLSPGDKVEFVLRVTWERGRARFPIVSIRELPAETALDLGN